MRRRAAALDGGEEWDEEHHNAAARHTEVVSVLARNQNSVNAYVRPGKYDTAYASSGPRRCEIRQYGDKFCLQVRMAGIMFSVQLHHDGNTFVYHDKSNHFIKHAALYFWELDWLYKHMQAARKALHLLGIPTDLHTYILEYAPTWDRGAFVEPDYIE